MRNPFAQLSMPNLSGALRSKTLLQVLLALVVGVGAGYELFLRPALKTHAALVAAQHQTAQPPARWPANANKQTLALAETAFPSRSDATVRAYLRQAARNAGVAVNVTSSGAALGLQLMVSVTGSPAAIARYAASLESLTLSRGQLHGHGPLWVVQGISIPAAVRGGKSSTSFSIYAPDMTAITPLPASTTTTAPVTASPAASTTLGPATSTTSGGTAPVVPTPTTTATQQASGLVPVPTPSH